MSCVTLRVPWRRLYDPEYKKWYQCEPVDLQLSVQTACAPSLQETVSRTTWRQYQIACPPRNHTYRVDDVPAHDMVATWDLPRASRAPAAAPAGTPCNECRLTLFPFFTFHALAPSTSHDPHIRIYASDASAAPKDVQWVQGTCTPLGLLELPRDRTSSSEYRLHTYVNSILVNQSARYHVHQTRIGINALPHPWCQQLWYVSCGPRHTQTHQRFVVVSVDVHPAWLARDASLAWVQPFRATAATAADTDMQRVYFGRLCSETTKRNVAFCILFHVLLLACVYGDARHSDSDGDADDADDDTTTDKTVTRTICAWLERVRLGFPSAPSAGTGTLSVPSIFDRATRNAATRPCPVVDNDDTLWTLFMFMGGAEPHGRAPVAMPTAWFRTLTLDDWYPRFQRQLELAARISPQQETNARFSITECVRLFPDVWKQFRTSTIMPSTTLSSATAAANTAAHMRALHGFARDWSRWQPLLVPPLMTTRALRDEFPPFVDASVRAFDAFVGATIDALHLHAAGASMLRAATHQNPFAYAYEQTGMHHFRGTLDAHAEGPDPWAPWNDRLRVRGRPSSPPPPQGSHVTWVRIGHKPLAAFGADEWHRVVGDFLTTYVTEFTVAVAPLPARHVRVLHAAHRAYQHLAHECAPLNTFLTPVWNQWLWYIVATLQGVLRAVLVSPPFAETASTLPVPAWQFQFHVASAHVMGACVPPGRALMAFHRDWMVHPSVTPYLVDNDVPTQTELLREVPSSLDVRHALHAWALCRWAYEVRADGRLSTRARDALNKELARVYGPRRRSEDLRTTFRTYWKHVFRRPGETYLLRDTLRVLRHWAAGLPRRAAQDLEESCRIVKDLWRETQKLADHVTRAAPGLSPLCEKLRDSTEELAARMHASTEHHHDDDNGE